MFELRGEELVLAGAGEVRMVGSIAEAEREMARGFRPEVVLVGRCLGGRQARRLARAIRAGARRAEVPVLAISGDGGRVHITPVDGALEVPADPEELGGLLRALDHLCGEPLLQAG